MLALLEEAEMGFGGVISGNQGADAEVPGSFMDSAVLFCVDCLYIFFFLPRQFYFPVSLAGGCCSKEFVLEFV